MILYLRKLPIIKVKVNPFDGWSSYNVSSNAKVVYGPIEPIDDTSVS
jgi:hypothetical protein